MSGSDKQAPLPAQWFRRIDETPDEAFYATPRLVAHIDAATIDALTAFYESFIPEGSDVLDLMSSWISHLPTGVPYGRVAGLGMNASELQANPQLTDWIVHNLNVRPELPYEAESFDRILIAVSIQYLTRPVEVMASARRVLRQGGSLCIAMSHRLFPTKAVMAFHELPPLDRAQLAGRYLEAGGFRDVSCIDRSPPEADPLWLVTGRR